MQRRIGTLGLLVTLATTGWAAAPPVPGSRGFSPEQVRWLNKINSEITGHGRTGRFEEAERLGRERLVLLGRVLGQGHWRTRNETSNVEDWQRLTKVPARQREEVGRAIALNALGSQRERSGQYAEALTLLREALAISDKTLGEGHPSTAACSSNVASCLQNLGKHKEALPLYKKALAISEKVLGQSHLHTATYSNNNVARCWGRWTRR